MSWRVPLSQPIYTIFGANTGVGKTIISTLLVRAFAPAISYIKPVSTGPLSDADYLHVDKFTGVVGKVLFQFETPCSPHLAAGPNPPSDSSIISQLVAHLQQNKKHPTLIETAGGVHSPAPSGSSQLELFRPLRLPVILVADSNLGGISTTISAYESLRLHGFDVAAIIGFRAEWGNMPYIASKMKDFPVLQIPAPPPRQADPAEDAENLSVYYDLVSETPAVQALQRELLTRHADRLKRLREMPQKALDKFWYPFTQHSHLSVDKVTTIDSAHQDSFAAFTASDTALRPVFDGSASWWTQGLGHGNSELALDAAYAMSRYGHVILPNAVNEPALAVTEKLLETSGRVWASRVFFSDNGTTGIEIALKMALKAARVRYGAEKDALKLEIIGYTGSYHGDTVGAMDASDPNPYNAEVDWYQTRGLFFDPPSLVMISGQWKLNIPAQAKSSEGSETFDSLSEVFDLKKRANSQTASLYRAWIKERIDSAVQAGRKFGALLFEPILLGAGGMVFVDPLFQRLLVDHVRSSSILCPDAPEAAAATDSSTSVGEWTGLPVITDEVFTGLYRLSSASAFDLLDIKPDISVNAKLLTGGALPLATTMSSESIFRVFFKDEKTDALLHGHSYTAHPAGTQVALSSLEILHDLYAPAGSADSSASHAIRQMKQDWQGEPVFSIWSRQFIHTLSHHEKLEGVICLGSVFAITLKEEAGGKGGYGSMVSTRIVDALRDTTSQSRVESQAAGQVHGELGGIMIRPLGNVIYIMASQVTTREQADMVQSLLIDVL